MTRGKKIREARKALGRGWTQAALAKALARHGLKKSWSWVAGIENDRFNLHPDDLVILAKVLNKPTTYFDEHMSSMFADAPDTIRQDLNNLAETVDRLTAMVEALAHLEPGSLKKNQAHALHESNPKLKRG